MSHPELTPPATAPRSSKISDRAALEAALAGTAGLLLGRVFLGRGAGLAAGTALVAARLIADWKASRPPSPPSGESPREPAGKTEATLKIPSQTDPEPEAEAENAPASIFPSGQSSPSPLETVPGTPMPPPAEIPASPGLPFENSGQQLDSAADSGDAGEIPSGSGSKAQFSPVIESSPETAIPKPPPAASTDAPEAVNSSALPIFPDLKPLPAFPPFQPFPASDPAKIQRQLPEPEEGIFPPSKAMSEPEPEPKLEPEPEFKAALETERQPASTPRTSAKEPEIIPVTAPVPVLFPASPSVISSPSEPVFPQSSAETDFTDPLLVFAGDFSDPLPLPETSVSPKTIAPMPTTAAAAPFLPSWPEKQTSPVASPAQNEEQPAGKNLSRTVVPPPASPDPVRPAPVRPFPMPVGQTAPASAAPVPVTISEKLPEFPALSDKKTPAHVRAPLTEPEDNYRGEPRFSPSTVLIIIVLMLLIIAAVWVAF